VLYPRLSKLLASLALLVLCAFVAVACGQTATTQVPVSGEQPPTTQIAVTSEQTATTQVAVTSQQTTTTQVSASPSVALIYNGKVAAEGGPEALAVVAESLGMEVTYFDDAGKLPSLLGGATVCVIGGTEDDLTPLLSEFTPEIRQTLSDWLTAGGGYLGICGGGYIASNGWEDVNGFVDALGIVPLDTEAWVEESDPLIITVTWNGAERPIYYQYGPVFLAQDESNMEVLLRYDDGRVAGLATDFGEGRVVVCGPHPEADATWLDDDPAPVDADNWQPTQDLAAEMFQALAR
jgi:hypothetical protein